MKNYKEMADAVFRRRDEYAVELKRKKKIALNTSLSLCAVCLAILGAFGIWKLGVVEPDPSVIGTKPQSVTHTQATTLQGQSHATSEGDYSESTHNVTPNKSTESTGQNAVESSKPKVTLPTGSDKPSNATKPTKATDPVENPTKATDPVEKPTQATKPTHKPATKPEVPPTRPVTPDPTEDSGGSMTPDIIVPTTPDSDRPDFEPLPPPTTRPPVSDEPTSDGSAGDGYATEATSSMDPESPPADPTAVPTEPAWTIPTEAPVPVTTAPATTGSAEVPPTSVELVHVYGKVVDENGNGIEGATVRVHYKSDVYMSAKTNAKGEFDFGKMEYKSTMYVNLYALPSGYASPSTGTVYLTNKNFGQIIFNCNKL